MTSTLEKLKSSIPNCLEQFSTKNVNEINREKMRLDADFVIKQIVCQCGSENLNLSAMSKTETQGFFRKKLVTTLLAPVFVECPNCTSKHLLFDPSIHGWDGRQGENTATISGGESKPFRATSGRVIVSYSYQNIENYEDLIEGSVTDPENYFDTFAVYFSISDNELDEVVSYECA